MQSQAQRLISLFRITVLAGVTALLITSAALSMPAQNSIPPTAVQAARMPEFAKRLGHPANRTASPPKPAVARQGSHKVPGEGEIYDNGPINGNTDAWTINFGFVISDTFTVNVNQTPITGMSFGAWLYPGDTLSQVELSITSEPNGGTTYFNQYLSFTQAGCTYNQYGFNVCTESTTFNGPTLNAGTYWLNLQNATTLDGNPVYWDENSGVGCDSPGCPSLAQENTVGTIPSESFTIQGNPCFNPAEEKPATAAKVVTVPPSPTQNYRVIYNFTGGADGAVPTTGLAIDSAGNLYGTTIGGPDGRGTVFKLTPRSSGWTFSRLYTFTGANGDNPDSSLVIAADGTLLGTTFNGGVGQGYGNGVLFGLSPAGNILPTPFSNWMETLLYDFTAGSDGASPGGSFFLDSSGNIYGSAAAAGGNRGGTLYEFTNGGIQVLHAFPAFQLDGSSPGGVVSGSNGLYGITASGGANRSGTFYTTAGGYQVLHSFNSNPEGNPVSLTADQAGNLYVTASYVSYMCTKPGGEQEFGTTSVFQMSPPGWDPLGLVSLQQFDTSLSSWISTDASGNIYGTTDKYGGNFSGNVFKLTCCWNYTDLHDFAGGTNDGAYPAASPVVDAQGNIYGTTQYGGLYGNGVVWEISP